MRMTTMIIQWPSWRIKSEEHGYVIQRKLKSGRWVSQWFLTTLAEACDSLLQYRIRTETAQYVIDATNEASAALGRAELISKIEEIGREILAGVNDVH